MNHYNYDKQQQLLIIVYFNDEPLQFLVTTLVIIGNVRLELWTIAIFGDNHYDNWLTIAMFWLLIIATLNFLYTNCTY